MNIGFPEIIVILVIAVLVFGSRLPEVGREVGRAFNEFKRGLRDIRDSSGIDDSLRDFRDLRNESHRIARTEYDPFGTSSDESWNVDPEHEPTTMIEDPDDTFTEQKDVSASEDSAEADSTESTSPKTEGDPT
ncbi:MAG: twin-arginine translocase TatA/TatE family subunit [Planctomycetota bacterium]